MKNLLHRLISRGGFSGVRRWWLVSIGSLLLVGGLLLLLARASTAKNIGNVTAIAPAGKASGVRITGKTSGVDVQTPLLPLDLGPSVVTTSGRLLLVSKRNADGTLGAAAPYEIRGVNWSPASKDTLNNLTARRAEFGKWYLQDIPKLKAMNVNTVRLFIDPGTDATGWAVMDELYRNGIMAIVTVDEAVNNTARAQDVVNFYKRHPAVLMWMLGNEWNVNKYYDKVVSVPEAALLTQAAAALIKPLDADHPVVSSYGELDFVSRDGGTRLADTQNYVNNVCTSVDLWALNIYRSNTFSDLFTQWAALSTKPMFIGEFGTDAFRSFNQNSIPPGPPGLTDGAMQSHWDFCLWNELLNNAVTRDTTKVASGGCVFEWNDEWSKVLPEGSQQTNGFPLTHPDGFANEEYFGIVDIDRQPRPVYALLATAFAPAYQASPTIPFRASSRGGGAEEYAFQLGVARFYKCGAYRDFYEKTGGGGGGRGFNVAAIDAATGGLIGTARNFDTYQTRGNGDAMRAMIAFLNSLPNGTLILMAVADEAGLNQDGSCNPWPQPWTEDGFRALESLGSTRIRNYCFRDSWAMAAVKGEGRTRQETLNNSGEASAEVIFKINLPGYEADVAPRPEGNGTVTVADWVQVGRFISGLDAPNQSNEFQRADCAPRASLGNGLLSISDWVQAGRYAAGLDPIVIAGGPTAPVGMVGDWWPPVGEPRSTLHGNLSTVRGNRPLTSDHQTLAIVIDAQGGENAIGFSLCFLQSQWRFVSAERAAEVTSATLIVNTGQAALGSIGVAVALPAGRTLRPGAQGLLTLNFKQVTKSTQPLLYSFSDQPIVCEISDANANRLRASFATDFGDNFGMLPQITFNQSFFDFAGGLTVLGTHPLR